LSNPSFSRPSFKHNLECLCFKTSRVEKIELLLKTWILFQTNWSFVMKT
jgi:hypothetical protein